MKAKFFSLCLVFLLIMMLCGCKQNKSEKKDPVELMEVTGIISGYQNDVMYLKVLRTGMVHPLRITEKTRMDVFAGPRDTVLLVYTGYLGYTLVLPEIHEVQDIRPYIETGSKVVNLNDLKNSGELITRP